LKEESQKEFRLKGQFARQQKHHGMNHPEVLAVLRSFYDHFDDIFRGQGKRGVGWGGMGWGGMGHDGMGWGGVVVVVVVVVVMVMVMVMVMAMGRGASLLPYHNPHQASRDTRPWRLRGK
jgi:hypothetical protein